MVWRKLDIRSLGDIPRFIGHYLSSGFPYRKEDACLVGKAGWLDSDDAFCDVELDPFSCLVTALVFIAVITTYFIRKWYLSVDGKFIRRAFFVPQLVAESAIFTCIIALVFVFLRPIHQFIYFQF